MAAPPKLDESFAAPPRVPQATPALEKAEIERDECIRSRERLEQRSILRGLILLALVALIFSIWRAGGDRVLLPHWWHP